MPPFDFLEASAEDLIARGIAPIKREFRAVSSQQRQAAAAAAAAGGDGLGKGAAAAAGEAAPQAAAAAAAAAAAGGGEQQANEPAKSKRQQKRDKRDRAQAAVRMCNAFLLGTCRFGVTCKFSHDTAAYLASKPLDLPGACPFSLQPSCPHGLACRWARSHAGQQAAAGAPAAADGATSTTSATHQDGSVPAVVLLPPLADVHKPVNPLTKELQQQLRKRSYNFKRADAAVQQVRRLLGPIPSNKRPPEPPEEQRAPGAAAGEQQQQQPAADEPALKRPRAEEAGAHAAEEQKPPVGTAAPPAAAAAAPAPGSDAELLARVKQEPGPSIKQEPGPSIKQEAAPSIKQEAAPNTKQEPAPSIKQQPGPNIKQQPGPNIKQQPGPNIKQEPGLQQQQHAAPAASAAAGGGTGGIDDDLDALYAEEQQPSPAAAPPAAAAAAAAPGSDAELLARIKQEPGLHIKQEPGPLIKQEPGLNIKQEQQQQHAADVKPPGGWLLGGCLDGAAEPRARPALDLAGKTYLAPLTTVGNLPFRRLCVDLGCQVTCGEMALGTNLLSGQPSEWALLRRHPSEKMFGVQVCGGHADTLARTGQLLDEALPPGSIDFVDLNCGCPIDLVCSKGAGSALLLRQRRLAEVVCSLTATLPTTPVIVKLRKGYFDNQDVAHTIIPQLPLWGASGVTLHGRSRQQRYSRAADWAYIKRCAGLAAAAGLPMVGNGDVFSPQEWAARLAPPANDEDDGTEQQPAGYDDDGNLLPPPPPPAGITTAMIGRAALIKPWIFTEIAESRLWDISASERLDQLKDFVRYGLEHWGSDEHGVETTRRFLLEWLSFTHRYIPVGLLEVVPQVMAWRPPAYATRSALEGLLSSEAGSDWVAISEMLLGPTPPGFTFTPKHKSSAHRTPASDVAAQVAAASASGTAAAAEEEEEDGEENG